jgi:two-component system cell cycle sensor histidine kinase/response regulator CckA
LLQRPRSGDAPEGPLEDREERRLVHAGAGRTVLIVEDNPITRKLLRVALEIGGYEVIDASDGRTALEITAERRPDLLVLDYVLPDMDGLELLAEIRRRGPAEIPAIVVTGMVSRLDEFRRRAGPSTHFLPKPVEPSHLLEAVRGHLAPPASKRAGPRILVVDDELLNRKLTSFRLEAAGYEVEAVASGAAALESARRSAPDAILSDVMMPVMDGFSLCREARLDQTLASIPVVLLSSAYVDDADRDLARKMGAHALVVRTPDLHAATAALKEALAASVPVPVTVPDNGNGNAVAELHRDRLQVQLERQNSHNEMLLRQAAIQATALSLIRGLSEVLAQPNEVPQILGDVLAHCLDAAGLSTGLLYMAESGGHHRLQAQFGVTGQRKADAELFFGHPELIRRIAVTGQPLAISAATKGGDADVGDFLTRVGHSSILILPFVVLGQTFGELVLASDDHDLTETAWIGFARSLALQFGQTVALGQSLKRLAESEASYRALMENAKDAIFILDEGGKIREANRMAETLLALPRNQMVGRHISAFAPAGTGGGADDTNAARFQELVAAGGGRSENVQLRRGDGALVAVDFSQSITQINGATSVLAIGRDVTDRNRGAGALRDAERRLHHVVSSSPAVLYSLRLDGERLVGTWVSENVERLTGYAAAVVNAPEWWVSHIHPDDRERVTDQVAALLAHGSVAREYRFRHKGGAYRWVHDEQLLIADADGWPEVIGSWTDVTDRKEAEQRLQRSDKQYQLLFDRNPYPMWVFDLETLGFLAVNDAAVRDYGWTRDEFLHLTLADVRPATTNPALEDHLAAVRAEPDAHGAARVWRHQKRDGTCIDAEVVATTITFRGRRARLTLTADVTERTALQTQLAKAQKMEAVGQLAGGIAHDFNNLLGVITGYSELLIREVPADSRERKRAEEIKRAADRAAALTRQLLAFSRRQVLQPKVLDLNEVVPEVEKMLRRLIPESIQIVIVAGADLGRVRADAGQLEQVLMNLAINARDAMPVGGRLVIETANADLDETYVRTNPEAKAGRYVMLVVSDTGHGMDEPTMSRIFEPFFTTKEEGRGTGLGLATVYGIVRQSGGTVNVYSEPGRGTSFKVYLPRVDDQLAAVMRPDLLASPGGVETILLVEDSDPLRMLIRELLENVGYTVLDASAPDAALALAEKTATDVHLLLTDMVMPGMSGQELARRVAILKPRSGVVFMSGYTDQLVGEEGTLAPGTHFLQKPFTMDALLKTLRRALDAGPGIPARSRA